MSKFSVVWHPDVEAALANLVLEHWGSPQLEQLSQASAQIDRWLAERPNDVGTSAGSNLRYLAVSPLAVLYAVFEEDCKVVLLEYRYLA